VGPNFGDVKQGPLDPLQQIVNIVEGAALKKMLLFI
jgi:hypothetical protein